MEKRGVGGRALSQGIGELLLGFVRIPCRGPYGRVGEFLPALGYGPVAVKLDAHDLLVHLGDLQGQPGADLQALAGHGGEVQALARQQVVFPVIAVRRVGRLARRRPGTQRNQSRHVDLLRG